MKINIDKLLKREGKSRYWLAKQIGCSYPTMKQLADNKSEATRFIFIERICKSLNCTIDELITIEEDSE